MYWEKMVDGSRRYIGALTEDWDGFKVEATYRNREHTTDGDIKVRIFDQESDQELVNVCHAVYMRKIESGRKLVVEIVKGQGKSEEIFVVYDPNAHESNSFYEGTRLRLMKYDLRGDLLLLTVYMLMDLGADQIQIKDGISAYQNERFMELLDSKMGVSRMEEFYETGLITLEGGMNLKIDWRDEWEEGQRGKIYVSLYSQDSEMNGEEEAYLDATVWHEPNGTVGFAIEVWREEAEIFWQKKLEKNLELNRLNHYLDDLLDDGRQNENCFDLKQMMLFLTLRFLYQRYNNMAVFDYTHGAPRQIGIDKNEVYALTESLLRF